MLQQFLLGCFCLLMSNLVYCEEHWQQPNFILHSFLEIALKNEFTSQPSTLRKWDQPVYVWIDHRVGDEALHSRLVRMHLAHLSALTGQYVGLVANEQQANVRVVFTTQGQWEHDVEAFIGASATKHVKNTVCMASFKVNQASEIISAVVVIPVDQAIRNRKLVSCVVEELTQIMGLPNDSEKVFPSIFNDKTPDDLMTGLDGLLLKMLYHPYLTSGMKVNEVIPNIKKIIQQWQQDGTIQNATQTVHQGELYPLMGF